MISCGGNSIVPVTISQMSPERPISHKSCIRVERPQSHCYCSTLKTDLRCVKGCNLFWIHKGLLNKVFWVAPAVLKSHLDGWSCKATAEGKLCSVASVALNLEIHNLPAGLCWGLAVFICASEQNVEKKVNSFIFISKCLCLITTCSNHLIYPP